MLKSVKSRAEEQFRASQKKDKQALKEREKAEHTASLKSLRLAKEAADKKAADESAAKKATKGK